jgi:hypothetical protein
VYQDNNSTEIASNQMETIKTSRRSVITVAKLDTGEVQLQVTRKSGDVYINTLTEDETLALVHALLIGGLPNADLTKYLMDA